jgi:hypothetical protein
MWAHFTQKNFFCKNTGFWKKRVLCQKLLMNLGFLNITFDPNNQNTSMIAFWKVLWVYKIEKIQTQIFGTNSNRVTSHRWFFFQFSKLKKSMSVNFDFFFFFAEINFDIYRINFYGFHNTTFLVFSNFFFRNWPLFCEKKHQNSHCFRSNVRIHKCHTILKRWKNEKNTNSDFWDKIQLGWPVIDDFFFKFSKLKKIMTVNFDYFFFLEEMNFDIYRINFYNRQKTSFLVFSIFF